jgi:hypothetical protein
MYRTSRVGVCGLFGCGDTIRLHDVRRFGLPVCSLTACFNTLRHTVCTTTMSCFAGLKGTPCAVVASFRGVQESRVSRLGLDCVTAATTTESGTIAGRNWSGGGPGLLIAHGPGLML